MSDGMNGLIKAISQLTSPKSAIKYISIAAFIVVLATDKVGLNKFTSSEYLPIIIFLLAAGLGTLTGEFASYTFGSVFASAKKYFQNLKTSKERVILTEKLKENFESRLKALSTYEKEVLYQLYIESKVGNDPKSVLPPTAYHLSSTMSEGKLHKLGFIDIVEKIDGANSFVKINPQILPSLESWLQEGLEKEVDDFLSKLKQPDLSLLKLLSKDVSEEEKQRLSRSFRTLTSQFITHYSTPCMIIKQNGSRGFVLEISKVYKGIFEKKLGFDMVDRYLGSTK